MKKVFVFAAALIFAGAVSMAQEPVKKSQEPQKTEKTCCSKDKKTEAHKCSGNCKDHQKDATKKCSGDCKNHK